MGADSGSLAQYRQGDSVAAAGVEIKGVSMTTTAAVGAVMVLGEMVTGGLFLENMKMEKQRTSLPYPTLARQILQVSRSSKPCAHAWPQRASPPGSAVGLSVLSTPDTTPFGSSLS